MTYLQHLLSNSEFNLDSNFIKVSELSKGILHLTPIDHTVSTKAVISCGIHGNETAPIEIMDEILSDLLSGKLNLACELLLIFGNIEAMKQAKRFVDFNLNRLFSANFENHLDSQEASIAENIEKVVKNFFSTLNDNNLHLDLHTAIFPSHHPRFAICPKRDQGEMSKEQMAMLSSLGLDALVIEKNKSTTFSSFTQNLLKDKGFSSTVELGQVKPFGKNDHTKFETASKSLRHLVSNGNLAQAKLAKVYRVARQLIKDHDDYELFVTKEDINFTKLNPEKALEKKLDGLTYPDKDKDEYLIFPNANVVVGQRSGLILNNEDLCD